MASIIQRATIAYLENAIATGLIDKLRSESDVDATLTWQNAIGVIS